LPSSVSHLRAIGFALASFTLWVFTDTCVKLSGEATIPPYEIVGIVGVIQVAVTVLMALPRREVKKLWPRRFGPQFGRAFLSVMINFCNALALRHLPLTTFYVVIFMMPMLIAILAAVFLHEKLSWQRIVAIVAGFGGVVYAINPAAPLSAGDLTGYIALAVSVVASSTNMVWLRTMTQTESLGSLVFFSGLVAAIAGLLAMLVHFVPLTDFTVAVLLTAGLFNVIGNFYNYKALKYTVAANVSQFHYTQIITGAIIGYLIWHDVPSLRLVIGAIIIIASGLYIAARARKIGKAPLVPL